MNTLCAVIKKTPYTLDGGNWSIYVWCIFSTNSCWSGMKNESWIRSLRRVCGTLWREVITQKFVTPLYSNQISLQNISTEIKESPQWLEKPQICFLVFHTVTLPRTLSSRWKVSKVRMIQNNERHLESFRCLLPKNYVQISAQRQFRSLGWFETLIRVFELRLGEDIPIHYKTIIARTALSRADFAPTW